MSDYLTDSEICRIPDLIPNSKVKLFGLKFLRLEETEMINCGPIQLELWEYVKDAIAIWKRRNPAKNNHLSLAKIAQEAQLDIALVFKIKAGNDSEESLKEIAKKFDNSAWDRLHPLLEISKADIEAFHPPHYEGEDLGIKTKMLKKWRDKEGNHSKEKFLEILKHPDIGDVFNTEEIKQIRTILEVSEKPQTPNVKNAEETTETQQAADEIDARKPPGWDAGM